MAAKYLILFLSTFLLLQSSLSKPLPSAEEESSGEVIDSLSQLAEKPSFQLIFYVMEAFSELSDSSLNLGKKVLQDVIADVSALDNKDEQITARLNEYTNFLTNIDKQLAESESTGVDKFDILTDLGDLFEKSTDAVNAESTSADKLFSEKLEQHGVSNIKADFREKFGKFADDFITKTNKILSNNDEEQLPQKQKVQEFLNEFQAATDVEERVTIFQKFFTLFA